MITIISKYLEKSNKMSYNCSEYFISIISPNKDK